MFGRIVVPRIKTFFLLFATIILISEIEAASRESEEEVPRGIYHFSDTDRDIETSFKIPNFEALDPIKVASDLMSSAMKVDTKRKTLAGIQMPFSLTGRPMSLQINGESHDAVSLIDDPKKKSDKKPEVRRSDMTPESRKAFLRARQVCLEQSANSCDQALDTFHRVRYGKSLLIGEGEEGNEENEQMKSIIERRLKEVEKTTPSTSYSSDSEDSTSSHSSSSSDPFTSSSDSESHEEEPEEEEEERIEDDEVIIQRPTTTSRRFSPPSSSSSSSSSSNRFSHITLPKYHDKANSFLRDIN